MRIPSKNRRSIKHLGDLAAPLMSAIVALNVLAAAPLTAAIAAPAPGALKAEVQEVSRLEALAKSEAALHLPPLSDRQRFLVGPIPQPVQLEHCPDGVKPSVGPAPHMKDRVLVELRCQGAGTWHIYVPVRIVGTSSVAVAAHAIVTGSVLTPNDLRVEQHDMTELPPGYLDDPAIAVGLTAARPISGGAILTNQQLVASKAVQRGQAVTLVADAGGMSVRMAGRALTDGLVNQRVRVQNLSSGKIVEGIARSEQVVEIIVQ
jgi:flagella basal body P-ring formation protein FlgA